MYGRMDVYKYDTIRDEKHKIDSVHKFEASILINGYLLKSL